MILPHDLVTNPKTAETFRRLPWTKRILDIGAGIRPCPIFCNEHICIEPHREYADILRQWQPDDRVVQVIDGEAESAAEIQRDGTTALLLDVIEHMERDRGLAIKALLEEFEHAVIFTPLGWYEQGDANPDGWGMNGGYWQKHRSAWQPEDFEGWSVHVWPQWHRVEPVGAILAIR